MILGSSDMVKIDETLHPKSIDVCDCEIPFVDSAKNLGLTINCNLSWSDKIQSINKNAAKELALWFLKE